jgi:hypothetical protein
MKKQDVQNQSDRILARRLARELPKSQLRYIAGGSPSSSTSWSSSSDGEGDDGGADD